MDDEMLIEDNVIKMPDFDFEVNSHGIGCEIFDCMKRNGDLLAQIDFETGKKDTYRQLLQRCIRTAIALKRHGITKNDIICVCSYNQLDSCVPYIAGLFIGVKLCSLDPSISYNDSKYLLNQVKPKIIFVVPENLDMYEKLLNDTSMDSKLIVFGDCGQNCFEEFMSESDEENDFVPEKVESVFNTACILFSSGTTGLAKGICLNHFALQSQAKGFSSFKFDSSVLLAYASLYWISAVLLLINAILKGHARILCKRFTPTNAWNAISIYKATLMFLAPNQAIAMLKEGKLDHIDPSSLKELIIGGAPISCENLMAIRELLPDADVFSAYGQTEIAGIGTVFRKTARDYLYLLKNKAKSCGRPIPGIWYKVVDLETEEALPCNEIGELRLKTKFEMNGYYDRDSSEAWDSDGWLKTGDVCYYDEDYCFYIVDRIKEMMKFQSWHVAPALLEGILHEHVAVKVAVVLGVPHDEDGEHPLGVVIRSDDAEDVEAETLVEYVNSRVDDRQKLRAGIIFVDKIPYTPTGKIQRKLLRDMILAELRK